MYTNLWNAQFALGIYLLFSKRFAKIQKHFHEIPIHSQYSEFCVFQKFFCDVLYFV